MHFLITGGTGFIGRSVCAHLLAQQHSVTVLTRNRIKAEKKCPAGVAFIESFAGLKSVPPVDIVVNLAGQPIANLPWFQKIKQKIYESRVNLTRSLIEALRKTAHSPKCFISGSAIGYYGLAQTDEPYDEQAPQGDGFAAKLCNDWEKEALKASALGARVCVIRTGLVLGKQGGMLAKLRLPFKFGMGGRLGAGKQWMSWIHLQDYIAIIMHCVNTNTLNGPINATAPNPVTNADFTKAYAKVLHRPAFMHLPAPIIKLLFGQMGVELLLSGQKVLPKKLLNSGYTFQFTDLQSALEAIDGQ